MGEAKRRKQLGLMPTVHPFEARMDTDGNVNLVSGPGDEGLREQIARGLRETQPIGDAWARSYRRAYVMAGLPQKIIETPEDLEAIGVPELRRLVGELVFNPDPRAVRASDDYLPLDGSAFLHLRSREQSGDGQRWERLPEAENVLESFQYLMQHPLSREKGALVASYLAEHWREGRIDFEPEPPEGQLEELEALVRDWHGETLEGWAETHFEALDLHEEEEDVSLVPAARRVVLELREPTPIGSPLSVGFMTLGECDVHVDMDRRFYTLDGETWHPYGDADAETEDEAGELGELLGNIFDVQTVEVTVWADGRVEWPEGGIPAEHEGRIRDELLSATGAGDPEAWAAFTTGVLREMFADEAPHLADLGELPVPQGMKIDLPTDALEDPDDPAQYFMESEVTFDGQTWRDLYAEELPEELERLRPSN